MIDLYLEDVELPNGKTGKREIVKHPGAVAVLALTDEENIILVKQYRKALERTIVEIPAGKLEKGRNPNIPRCGSLRKRRDTRRRSLRKSPLLHIAGLCGRTGASVPG